MYFHKTPRVTVVLPAYNAEKYIFFALSSILRQTFREIEIIVINDGSSDHTASIVKKLQINDSRIHLISRENKGLVHSLNEGIEIARTEWVARMDADDISYANRLERQLDYADSQKLDICGTYVKTFGMCKSSIRTQPISNEACMLQLCFNSCFAHPSVLLKRSILNKHRYDEIYTHIEDYELWTRLGLEGYTFGNVPDVLLNYRISPYQITNKNRQKQDKLRCKIAENYNIGKFGTKKGKLLGLLTNRQSINEPALDKAAQSLVEMIHNGKDCEGILLKNLSIFYIHNAANLEKNTKKSIENLIHKKYVFASQALNYLHIKPGSTIWNSLYLLK